MDDDQWVFLDPVDDGDDPETVIRSTFSPDGVYPGEPSYPRISVTAHLTPKGVRLLCYEKQAEDGDWVERPIPVSLLSSAGYLLEEAEEVLSRD